MSSSESSTVSSFLLSLCDDHHTAGFLLDNASDEWPINCLWSGNDRNGTCAPAPNDHKSIDYIVAQKWRKLIREFRLTIGCSKEQIKSVEKVQELYMCKERCTQAGIGYIASISIMSTLLISWAIFMLPSE